MIHFPNANIGDQTAYISISLVRNCLWWWYS